MTNKTNIKAWVTALESGKYRKTRCQLKSESGGSFCVLGVACRTFEKKEGLKLNDKEWGIDGNDTEGTLPKRVKNWLGLSSSNPRICVEFSDGPLCSSAIHLNDDIRVNFKKFAKGIRKTFEIN